MSESARHDEKPKSLIILDSSFLQQATMLTRKVCFVEGGHMMDTPAAVKYASVVSRESVQIDLLIETLKDLDVLSVDKQNVYLNVPPYQKA